jgi:hypothetical protein
VLTEPLSRCRPHPSRYSSIAKPALVDTGLAAMLYLQQIAGIDEEISERQLSVRYGHIGLPYISAAFAMNESWEILEEVLFGPTS